MVHWLSLNYLFYFCDKMSICDMLKWSVTSAQVEKGHNINNISNHLVMVFYLMSMFYVFVTWISVAFNPLLGG